MHYCTEMYTEVQKCIEGDSTTEGSRMVVGIEGSMVVGGIDDFL